MSACMYAYVTYGHTHQYCIEAAVSYTIDSLDVIGYIVHDAQLYGYIMAIYKQCFSQNWFHAAACMYVTRQVQLQYITYSPTHVCGHGQGT